MESIAQPRGRFQSLAHRQIEVFTSGVYVPKQGLNFVPDCILSPDRSQRGKITGFSVHARQRLRRLLVESSLPGSVRLGFTLTVPWRGVPVDIMLKEFKISFHRFSVKFRRAFPNSAAIFRVELQKRKAPHIHAIWYLSQDDIKANGLQPDTHACRVCPSVSRSLLIVCANNKINSMWVSSVPVFPRDNLTGFVEHGSQVDDIASNGAMFRYLADHTSKSKQEQLGYEGKQWGVIGGKNLVKIVPHSFSFKKSKDGEKSKAVLLRNLQKLCRYRVSNPAAPFGSSYRDSKRTIGTFYTGEANVSRLLDLPVINAGLKRRRLSQGDLC